MAVRHVNWFFDLLFGRTVVRERSLLRHGEMIRLHLEELGCAASKTLPEPVLTAIVQEAYRRAAEPEPDKLARYGRHHEQLRLLSAEIVAVLKKEPSADARIRSILEWNRLL